MRETRRIGTLRSDETTATRTSKKKKVKKKKNNFAQASHYFVHFFLPFLHDYDKKFPNFAFYRGHNNISLSEIRNWKFSSRMVRLHLTK